MGRRDANNSIKTNSALVYAHRLIARVNKEEGNTEGKNIKTTIGTIKVSGLSHKRGKQNDLRLAWETFHKIYNIYSDIKNKEGKMRLC